MKGDGTNEIACGESGDDINFLMKRGMRFNDAPEYIIYEAGLAISNINEKEWDKDILILNIHSREWLNMYATIFISPIKITDIICGKPSKLSCCPNKLTKERIIK